MSQVTFPHPIRAAALERLSRASFDEEEVEVESQDGYVSFVTRSIPKRIPWNRAPDSPVVVYKTRPEVRHSGLSEAQELFGALADRWEAETKVQSSYSRMFMNESYQQIIGLGPVVIPFILLRMKERGGHWFWALRSITRENPVDEGSQGDVAKMKHDWLAWGRKRGLI